MKVDIVTTTGEKNSEIDFNFEKKASDILISNAVLANFANKRVPSANTKTRSEVTGSGKKPWQQKGTGRARHGSVRSPIWIGGGITFGPRSERNFSKRINKKQNLLVLAYLLAKKAEEGKIVILDKIDSFSGKTKDVVPFFAKLGVDDNMLMVVDEAFSKSEAGINFYRACRNSQLVYLINVSKVNVYYLLKNEWVVMTKSAFERLLKGFEALESKRVIEKKEKVIKIEKPVKKVMAKKKVVTKKKIVAKKSE